MKNLFAIKKYSLVALLLMFGVGMTYADIGGNRTYYAKVRASVGTGQGKVYASANSTNNPAYKAEGNVVTKNQNNNTGFTFYMYAEADPGYDFTGWSTTANGSPLSNTAKSPYSYSVSSTAERENDATENNLYAIFKPLPIFYFSTTAIVVPNGAGTASVSPAVTNVYGEHWNSTSATTNTITFTATSGANHVFQGWSKTESGEIENSANSYNPIITSNSTNSGSPSNTTLYARFLPYPTGVTASPASMILGEGDSETINAVVTPSGSYSNIGFESSKTSVATVNANGVVTAVSGGEATITVKALKSDGVTVIATASVSVSVIEKCATPVITFEPSSDGKTATTTLSTTTENASIYYTIDGGEPSTSSTLYTGPFNVSNGQTVRAITVKLGCKESDVTISTFVATKVAIPNIDIASNGVSFSCETPGVSFYYTINGDNPTTSLTPWNGAPLTGLSEGTNIKVIAAKSGMIISDVATKLYYPASGVVGGIVTLNDYEDHNWSYYSDPDCPIHSWNPADVKITYYGNGSRTVATTNDDNPTSFTADATGVKVGIDADANTFVYYKTLERTDGSTAAAPSAATGRCAYTTIPNPFSVRPTYGSGDTRWRGFYKWRVKKVSGGTIHSASTGGATYAQGSTIDAEEDIYFAPNSEYGMEVEFEALWARAYVTKETENLASYSNSYERNFHVVTSSTSASSFQKSYPLTVTSRYPDGSNGGGSISGEFTASSDTKFENITITGATNSTWTANGHDLIVGRGCTGTVNYLRGISQNISNPNYTIRLESGTYKYLSYLRGYYTSSSGNTGGGSTVTGALHIKSILGCDYDRASNVNDNLKITQNAIMAVSTTVNSEEETLNITVKSGNIGSDIPETSTNKADAYQSIYLSVAGDQRKVGKRSLTVEGGILSNIAGGIDEENNSDHGVTSFESLYIRMKGGLVRGAIYGGAAKSPAGGNRRMIFTGGTVYGWVGAGCNGTEDSGGQTYGGSKMYIGGDCHIGQSGTEWSINGVNGGYVFGAGKGYAGGSGTSGEMSHGTKLVVADEAYIKHDVYGGGNYGYTTDSYLYILGGTIGGGAYGGSNQKGGDNTFVTMKDGIVHGGVYGGSNDRGTISNNVTMQINGGQVGTSSKSANIHGGGYGEDTKVDGNITLTLGSNTTDPGVTVYGDVYGGSALGTVNSDANDHTYVTMYKGTINGSLYGGGLGRASVSANVNGPVKVEVRGGSVKKTSVEGSGGVYGANNIYGAPQSSVTVDIYGTDPAPAEGQYALHAVYGGGNQANYLYGNGYPTVTIHGCDNSIEYVYGGGNAAAVAATDVTIWGGNTIGNVFGGGNGTVSAADVNGDTNLNVHGGTIINIFGGSNSQGTINGTINVTLNAKAETGENQCPINITSVYGGGNKADSKVGKLNIVCTGDNGRIDNVYGGANQANITGDIDLHINGGNIGNVFGGNNQSGEISGTITVTVGDNPEDCGVFEIDNVYGGGNLAAYGSSISNKGNFPSVKIVSGTINKNVYGGGLGDTADVYGNPHVNMTGGTAGNLFGGGDAANVVGNPVVTMSNGTINQMVFGGGNQADVEGNTSVTIKEGTIEGNVYGGGNNGNVAGTTHVVIGQ